MTTRSLYNDSVIAPRILHRLEDSTRGEGRAITLEELLERAGTSTGDEEALRAVVYLLLGGFISLSATTETREMTCRT